MTVSSAWPEIRLPSRRTELPQKPSEKIHLRYVRLPDQVMDLCDVLIYRSGRTIVGKSRIMSTHKVIFDGEVVLAPGFQIVYFELMEKWYTVGKIRDLQGRHTGYYCDIVTPPRLLKDGGIELTDLFLDLWVSRDLRYKILDEDELENAFQKRWISRRLYDKAKEQLKELIDAVKRGSFPPYQVKYLERKLSL